MCCKSPEDECGLCRGCSCRDAKWDIPKPAFSPTLEPSYYENYVNASLARRIWRDASGGHYPWYDEDECIEHPAFRFYGSKESYDAVSATILAAYDDPRLNAQVARKILFNSKMHVPMRQCETLVEFSAQLSNYDYPMDPHLRQMLRMARDEFVERMREYEAEGDEPNENGNYGNGHSRRWWIVTIGVVGALFASGCGCFCCFYCVARHMQTSNEDAAIAPAASPLPRSETAGKLPVASATPIPNRTNGDRIDIATACSLTLQPIASAPPLESSPSGDGSVCGGGGGGGGY
mmetsp:Transcript_10735/g.24055  ORF Transcript_10735/g.24055 Transcript_10735/m.24055 type:complete len:291 (-) Transcript_10735:14-886(-)